MNIDLDLLIVSVVSAWLYGSLLAAVAVALTLVFGLGRVVNFAIGSFYALGAFFTYSFRGSFGYWGALVCAVVCVAAVAALVERVAIARIRVQAEITTLLVTFGLAVLLNGLILVIWGTDTRTMSSPIGGSVSVGGQRMSVFVFVAAGIATAVSALVWILLRRTSTGTHLRAASQNTAMAELLGLNTGAMMCALFAFSAGIAALAGGFAGPIFAVRPGMDVDFLIDAFLAVVIGGLGSVRGAIVGAYVVALAKNLSLSLLTADIATAVSFVVVITIVLARPTGIFREGRAIA